MGEGPSTQGNSPEALFLAWLVAQPQGTDIATAARVEIARLGRIDIAGDTRDHLIGLLAQATVAPLRASRQGRRQRH